MGSVYKVIINSTGVFTIFLSVKTDLFYLIVQLDKLESICNCLKRAQSVKRGALKAAFSGVELNIPFWFAC
jgi:hypothetical protein